MTTSPCTAIVICTHKRVNSMERFLAGFQNLVQTPEDIIFVDNGSKESIHIAVSHRFPQMTVLRLPENRMFCGGYNAGIRIAMERGYDFVLLSNADAEPVNPGILKELLTVARRWPTGAFFGPLVFWRSVGIVQKTCLQFPTPARQAEQWVPFRLFRHWVERQPLEERTVEFLNGVCVLCRVQALRQFGLMDEAMGGYLEDADWAWRAQQQGWLSVYVPIPGVIHHEAPRGYEPYSLKSFLVKRNVVYWFLKNQKVPSACSYAYASLLLAGLRLLKAPSISEKQKHRYFFQRLVRAYSGLLRRESLGEWFGPPLGPWRHGNVL